MISSSNLDEIRYLNEEEQFKFCVIFLKYSWILETFKVYYYIIQI